MSGGRLGNNTKLVSPEKLSKSRSERRLLKEHAGELLPGSRVSWCMHKVKHDTDSLEWKCDLSQHRGFIDGVMLCASVWTCPVCSLRISEVRRAEIEKAIKSKSELLPVLLTLTLAHNAGEPLSDLVEALKNTWRKLKSGKAWLTTKERFHLVHYVSTFEIRHGANGWHPHFHVLLFLDMKERDFEPGELKAALQERYERLLAKHGRYASSEHGLHVKSCNGRKDLNEYLSKQAMSFEISKSTSKLGRDEQSFSPFQLLAQSMAGDERAGKLFKEYAKCMNGRKFIQWSRGAREYFELDAELTDEQTVEMLEAQEKARANIVTLVRMPRVTYYKVSRKRLLDSGLRITDSGDAQALSAFLELHGLRRDLDFEVIT